METGNITTPVSSEKTSQIIAGNDVVLPSPVAILNGAEGEEIVYLRGMRFVMLAALFVLSSSDPPYPPLLLSGGVLTFIRHGQCSMFKLTWNNDE